MRGLPAAAALVQHLDDLTGLLAPGPDVEARMRGRLAVSALVMSAARAPNSAAPPTKDPTPPSPWPATSSTAPDAALRSGTVLGRRSGIREC